MALARGKMVGLRGYQTIQRKEQDNVEGLRTNPDDHNKDNVDPLPACKDPPPQTANNFWVCAEVLDTNQIPMYESSYQTYSDAQPPSLVSHRCHYTSRMPYNCHHR